MYKVDISFLFVFFFFLKNINHISINKKYLTIIYVRLWKTHRVNTYYYEQNILLALFLKHDNVPTLISLAFSIEKVLRARVQFFEDQRHKIDNSLWRVHRTSRSLFTSVHIVHHRKLLIAIGPCERRIISANLEKFLKR